MSFAAADAFMSIFGMKRVEHQQCGMKNTHGGARKGAGRKPARAQLVKRTFALHAADWMLFDDFARQFDSKTQYLRYLIKGYREK